MKTDWAENEINIYCKKQKQTMMAMDQWNICKNVLLQHLMHTIC